MALVCPKCKDSFEQSVRCPSCGVRLLYESRTGSEITPAGGLGLHSAMGRVCAGILLAEGLDYGLQLLCHAFVQAAVDDAPMSVWTTLWGLVVLQAIQGISLFVGGVLAGAGKRQALALGAGVGLVHGLIFLGYHHLHGDRPTEVALYGQPLLNIMFGSLGAVLGAVIWRPLPVLAMPDFDTDKQAKPAQPRMSLFASLRGPVYWTRVLAGIAIVTGGFIWGPSLLKVLLRASSGTLRINDQLQAEIVTWEIIGLMTILGAAVAGATTPNGIKQGLFTGVGASILLVGNYLAGKSLSVELVSSTLTSIVCLSIVGGWFGGHLFPPVLTVGRRRTRWHVSLPAGESQ
jgi:hypothetical protein